MRKYSEGELKALKENLSIEAESIERAIESIDKKGKIMKSKIAKQLIVYYTALFTFIFIGGWRVIYYRIQNPNLSLPEVLLDNYMWYTVLLFLALVMVCAWPRK